jgi:HSP20 family protein
MSVFGKNENALRKKAPFVSWQQDMNRMMHRFYSDLSSMDSDFMEFHPKIQIKESKKNFVVSAEIPGMKESDVEVTLEDNTLILQGEKKIESEDEKDGFFTSEFSYGSFYRSIPLNEDVDPDSVKASCNDGVLKVVLNKVKESSHQAKKIQVLRS